MSPSLKQLLQQPDILLAPGVYDAFGALLAQQAGFSALYLSGASLAYTRYGVPDIGLVTMNEVATTLAAIKERIAIPLIVDADTGFGNALNAMRTIREFERCGANAIQLEDQVTPKRCGHLSGKQLVASSEMVGKIKAATDCRHNSETLIIARTDAIAVEGFEPAIERAAFYQEAGADVLFIEAPQTIEQMEKITHQFHPQIPLLVNMVEGGKTPLCSSQDLEKMGFSIVIFPGGLARSFAYMAQQYFSILKRDGSTKAFQEQMVDFKGLNDLLETEIILEKGRFYEK